MKEPDPETDKLAGEVIGCAIEVHRHLGPGYLEAVYESAFGLEMRLKGIPFAQQHPVTVFYKGNKIGTGRLDFLIDERLIVELKSVDKLAPVHIFQVRSYLKATGLELGLLINFNETRVSNGIRRIILTQ